MQAKKDRLFCLDALRGLDIIFLTWFRRLFVAVAAYFGLLPDWMKAQLRHPAWEGFTLWDQIMPCFIFMSGAAVPLALGRFLEAGRPTKKFFSHVCTRFAVLWILGMFVGGALTTLDVMQVKPYSNTLQAIASGYAIAAFVFLIRARWVRFLFPFALAAIYTMLLAWHADMSPSGNFAQIFEQRAISFLGFPNGAKAYATHDYTWFLTTLMFGAMALWGANCTEIVRSSLSWRRKVAFLLLLSGVLTALGLASQIWVPCVKHIFTVSFTCRSMGLCVAMLAALYVVTDVWKFRRGFWIVTLFGQFALTAYLAANAFMPVTKSFVERFLLPGVKNIVSPGMYDIIFAVAVAIALTIVLVVRRRLSKTSLV